MIEDEDNKEWNPIFSQAAARACELFLRQKNDGKFLIIGDIFS